MRTVPNWVNTIHEADKLDYSSVHTVCFSPDGTQLVVGAGEKVMVYDPRDGALIQLLQAHRGTVHAVAYCGDGKKFASGSADKNVIIWTSKMEGVLKYSHSEAVQCLAYNPATFHLVSCALSDFAFWSADVKAVQKYRISGRITCCAWSPTGEHLAIGLASGVVSIRNKYGEEVQRITRDAAVWAITFSNTTLLVTDWDEILSFYDIYAQPVSNERSIGIAALSVSILDSLVLVGGVGGWAILTSEGVLITNTPQDWVWSIMPSSTLKAFALGCQDGTLWCYQVVLSTVHGLYRDRYAFRENMTDVVVQHLISGNKVRIKCHDRVLKIAIHKTRLAVQLPDKLIVYEQADAEGMTYRVKDKMLESFVCSLLVTTSDFLLLCQDANLLMIAARVPKLWSLPASIRYVKVTTLYFEEVLLLGLLNGQIWLVKPSDGVLKMMLQTPAGVRCLDVNASRSRIAIVDEKSLCRVYGLQKGDLLFVEENVSSVSWHTSFDELLCLSGNGLLSIKAANFPPATQPLIGAVVGFQGGQVFCLQAESMETIQVPLSHAVHQYIENKMFNEAYAVACLGVTSLEWERLGTAALEELAIEVARNAFQRSENVLFLTFIDHVQERLEAGEKRAVIVGEVFAYSGRYSDAARSFQSVGRDDRALNMYVDLRMFNKAQEFVGEGEGTMALARRRAEWAQRVNEPRAAAEMYLAAGDVRRAAQLMADTGKRDMLIELARKLDKGSSDSLRHLAEALVTVGEHATAADVYQRLGDLKKVAQMAVSAGEWSRAFALARDHPECKREVYLPYAHRMAKENKFVEAQKAYHMAGETATAMRVFSTLVNIAISEERFADAGYLHHLEAAQALDSAAAATGRERDASVRKYVQNARLARVYHAYDAVHRCVHEPFSLSQPDSLLNAARCVLALMDGEPPPGVSLFCVYLCLAKQAKTLNVVSLARQMLDKILGLQIPPKFQESVELLTLKTGRGTVGSSREAEGVGETERVGVTEGDGEGREEDVSPLCWRCRRHCPPLAAQCPRCGHTPAISLATHEVLPLVQFEPAEGITYDEAFQLIERMPLPKAMDNSDMDGAQILTIDPDVDGGDPFLDRVDEEEERGVVVCSRGALLRLRPSSVVAVRPAGLAPLLYRNMLPELPVAPCPHCQSLFYLEDYEIQLVTKGHCPFCRQPPESMRDEDETDSLFNDSPLNTDSPTNGNLSWR